MTWGDVRDWVALMIVAAAVFFGMRERRLRQGELRRKAFIARFKADRDAKRFYEDHMKGSDKDFPGDKP